MRCPSPPLPSAPCTLTGLVCLAGRDGTRSCGCGSGAGGSLQKEGSVSFLCAWELLLIDTSCTDEVHDTRHVACLCTPRSTILGEYAPLAMSSSVCANKVSWGGFICTGVTYRAVSLRPRSPNQSIQKVRLLVPASRPAALAGGWQGAEGVRACVSA